eukprot:CAMPEP_0181326618 /NCGR_PEP_ID=MMETSP1101-20121128/21609_1 /TAXON_ID=46948 /ORGANISM="Rhodomonas abbreviata, Strain Caron Lab Isolate" /LENGTH=1138 /DNA_ID=CAMNT_0023435113 /DNA_START=148 /DNA_END=3564 /DNA_ORIENTATION=+
MAKTGDKDELEQLRAENEALQTKCQALSKKVSNLQWQLALARSSKKSAAMMTVTGTRHTRARLSSFHRDDGTDTGEGALSPRGDSGGFSRDDLSDIVRLTFDNSTAADVKANVQDNSMKIKFEAQTFLDALDVNMDKGIDESEVEKRQGMYGKNVIPLQEQTSLFELMLEALKDPTLIFLCFAAVVSLIIGVFVEQDPMGWLEGTAILTAVFVVVMVGSVNDYQKESQFRALNAKKDDMQVVVLREGVKKTMSCHDLVVGDIVILSGGDIVSCDGYVVGRNDLALSEKMLTGEPILKKKGEYSFEGDKIVTAPTIFAGTFVQEGEGRMLVMAVGTATYQGTMNRKMDEADAEHSRSVLQVKLDDMTNQITQGGAAFAIFTVVILAIRMAWSFHSGLCCKEVWDHHVHWSELLGFLISGVTIFVVAVPEGLPLAVTIALAFSVKKMLKDQNLVRHLSACETMGGATTICSDKTGTLTTSKMTVVKIFCGKVFDAEGAVLPDKLSEVFIQAAVINTMSKTQLSPPLEGLKEPQYQGNDTECGLLVMANNLGAKGKPVDYKSEDQEYKRIRRQFPEDAEGRKQFTFSSDRKRMSTRIKDGKGYKIFCKGAAEMVVDLCTERYVEDGSVQPFDAKAKQETMDIINRFADEALRTICLAVRSVDTAIDDVKEAEQKLTMIGLVGIEDPVRKEVPEAIKACRRAGIVVRMVTGDNMKTAAAIAKKCGIIEGEAEPGNVWDGKTFRDTVAKTGKLDQAEFDKIWEKLLVMGRSTPLDKHHLVSGLQAANKKQTVAVTGDGTNDAPALKKADVGFAMGIQGTDVAKNASDVIIMDDNFVSIVKAVLWGRCVYDNICRFLQFQLTVNITAIFVACLGSAVLTESPLTAIQMLWVNLIMDSFASLALATEDPNDSLLNRKPYSRERNVLSKTMVKNMLLHAAWQLVVLVTLILFVGDVCQPGQDICDCVRSPLSDVTGYHGTKPFYIPSGRPAGFDLAATADSGACPPLFDEKNTSTWTKVKGVVTPKRAEDYCKHARGGGGDTTQHYTMVFNVFVLMQLFNEINSRKIHNEFNVFNGITKNYLFLIIVIGTLLGQVALIEAPGINTAFGCQGLTLDQWLVCLALGASCIPLNLFFRLIPCSLFPGAD